MTPAEKEYERLLHKPVTEEEMWAGYWELVRKMDKLNIAHNNICDNDEKEGDLYP